MSSEQEQELIRAAEEIVSLEKIVTAISGRGHAVISREDFDLCVKLARHYLATRKAEPVAMAEEPIYARPLEEYHEDYGEVLWVIFPIEEPPYVGSPLCSDWPECHTHWLPLPDSNRIVPQPQEMNKHG